MTRLLVLPRAQSSLSAIIEPRILALQSDHHKTPPMARIFNPPCRVELRTLVSVPEECHRLKHEQGQAKDNETCGQEHRQASRRHGWALISGRNRVPPCLVLGDALRMLEPERLHQPPDGYTHDAEWDDPDVRLGPGPIYRQGCAHQYEHAENEGGIEHRLLPSLIPWLTR